MKWTPQQTDAIETQGRSIIVSAAAGSGKTAVLVERLLRILSDPHPDRRVRADSMVVVTFTNDAAAQMKQRLTNKLTEALSAMESGSDPEVYDWLLEQRAGLSSAKISTIHSFCFDLIRDNAESCGVSPLFSIAEPAQERIYQQHALQSVMESWSRRPEMETLFSQFCAREDAELETVVLAIADYMDSLPFRRDWAQQAIRLCQDGDAVFERYRTAFFHAINDLLQLIEHARPAAQAVVPADANSRYVQKLDKDIAALLDQKNYILNVPQADLLENPLKSVVKFETFPRQSKKEATDEDARELFKQFCELYSSQYKESIIPDYLEPLRYFEEDVAVQRTLIPLLLSLTEDYLDALFAEKCRRNVLSFSDAEELALGLLGKIDRNGQLCRTELAESLSRQISLIMVDEYQDSNNKQDCLFKLLSRDCRIACGKLYYGSNAFLVGDVKQSIYSFRQANPENFRRVIAESIPLASCKGNEMARIYLNQNFRSAPGVLNFVNRLFGTLMTERCGEVLYDEHEQLNFGSPVYTDAQDIRTVLLLPQPEALPKDADMQAECIADTISRMIRNGAVVLEGDGRQRPCEPKDFCILLRSVKTDGEQIIDALRRRNLPVTSDRESGLLSLPEVCLIRNLLRVIDNPMTDAAMAAVLVSPVYGFTAEDLALLKLHGKRRRLYLQLRSVAESDALPAKLVPLKLRCAEILKQLAAMRQMAEQTSLEDCIREIYDETDLLSLQSLYEDGESRREHLDTFLQEAQRYRENSDLSIQGCLNGWLQYLDRLTDAQKDIDIKPSAAESNCISIKTIHRSKGLEYPFVFAAHLEHRFNTGADSMNPIQANETGLLGLYLYDREKFQKAQSITFQYLLGGVRRRQKSEELRLLYVALTRARQQLFLVIDDVHTGAVKKKTAACNLGRLLQSSPQTAAALAPRAGCMQDWLLYFLFSSEDSDHFIRAMDEGKNSRTGLCEYCVWTKNTAVMEEKPALQEVYALPDAAVLAEMQAQVTFSYSSSQTALMSKYSVTQLAHPVAVTTELTRVPKLAADPEKQKALKGAAKGTAIHKVMQYINLSAAAQDLTAELERMQNNGILTAAEVKALAPEQLQSFLDSELYRRIAAASEVLRERQLFVRIGELNLPSGSALAAQYAGTDGMLIGTMDLLFQEKDGWVLVDYKSDYVWDASELLDAYSLQLGLYQKAAELMLDAPVKEAYLYSFTLGTAIRVPLNQIVY